MDWWLSTERRLIVDRTSTNTEHVPAEGPTQHAAPDAKVYYPLHANAAGTNECYASLSPRGQVAKWLAQDAGAPALVTEFRRILGNWSLGLRTVTSLQRLRFGVRLL
jgi:hypothetical protein